MRCGGGLIANSRLRSLDLIRGIAVLGILAVNIASFAAPTSSSYSPNLPLAGSNFDTWAFGFTLVVFEGKMRALFSILFGASLLLYIERKDLSGQEGALLQVRRLLWLLVFGFLHFALLWDGDILFLYAAIGLAALLFRHLPVRQLLTIALAVFSLWQAKGIVDWIPSAVREARVAAGNASIAERIEHTRYVTNNRKADGDDLQATRSGFAVSALNRVVLHGDTPVSMVIYNWGETLGYILLGMALLRSGFFAGDWPIRRVAGMAVAGLALGLVPTLGFAAWAHPRGYPELAMHLALGYGLSMPHLLMALGYAALLVLAAPRLLASWLGQRLEATGRMAFSNYLGTTVVMSAIFSGWGLGLFGQYGAAEQWLFVLLGWALLLGWSKPWLARFRQGPLEWLWRCLTEWKRLPLRR